MLGPNPTTSLRLPEISEKNPKINSSISRGNETFLDSFQTLFNHVRYSKKKLTFLPRRIFDFGAISKDETEKQKDHGIHSRPHDAKVRQKTLFLTAFSCRPALQFLGQVWFNKDLDRRLRSNLRLKDVTTW